MLTFACTSKAKIFTNTCGSIIRQFQPRLRFSLNMSCAIKFMKFVLVSFNLLFVLIGLALLVAGTWGILNISSFLHAIALAFDKEATGSELYQDTHLIQTIAYVCVALGLLIFLISFFGCCGVVTDSACLLITYAVTVSILFLAKLVCVLAFLILGERLTPIILDQVMAGLSTNYRGALGVTDSQYVSTYSHIMDTFMIDFECCGINDYTDFANENLTRLWHAEGRVYIDANGTKRVGADIGIPPACCHFKRKDFSLNISFTDLHPFMTNPNCPVKPIDDYHSEGCIEVISQSMRLYEAAFIIIPVVISVVEIIGVILAGALAYELKQEARRPY
uniref:CD63 antigen n=1 Tax=Schistocephalus solidus TaxID=70667 RepID=A0A0X3NVR2_SCHSO